MKRLAAFFLLALAALASHAASTVRILVAYTPSAGTTLGGASGVQTTAQGSINLMNQSFANSLISGGVQVVLTGPVSVVALPHEYTSMNDALNKAPSEPAIANAHDNSYADIVFIVMAPDAGSTECGLSNFMASQDTAFSVASVNCFQNTRTFQHEIGHVFGAMHAVGQVDDNIGGPLYAHGYAKAIAASSPNPAACFHTIMAYSLLPSQVTAAGCSTDAALNYWSLPGVTYNAQPIGISSTAYDAYLMGLGTRPATVAQFRSYSMMGPIARKAVGALIVNFLSL